MLHFQYTTLHGDLIHDPYLFSKSPRIWLMFLFKRKKPALLGVDISSNSVKIVELAKTPDGLEFRNYAVAGIPKADQTGFDDNSPVALTALAIRHALDKMGTRLTHAAAAVPDTAVISRVIQFPSGWTEDEIDSQIPEHAEQFIPFPLDEVHIDFVIKGPSPGQPDMNDVLVVASRREHVEDRAAALDDAGLRTEIMDVDAMAMEAACARFMAELFPGFAGQPYGIVDAGAKATTLDVIHERQVVFSREQAFGGQKLAEDIQKKFNLSTDEAERAQRTGGKGLPENYRTDVLEPFVLDFSQQILRALHYFRSSQNEHAVQCLLLAGGCAVLPGLVQALGEAEVAHVAVANPFVNMTLGPRINRAALQMVAPRLLVACGLALRGFD